MIGQTMCSIMGLSDVVYMEEAERSKNRSLRNPHDQLMCFGLLPPPRPAKWSLVMPSDYRVDRRF